MSLIDFLDRYLGDLGRSMGTGASMEVRILGPVQIYADGGAVRIGSCKQRILLALLACHRGSPVSVDRLVEALWDEGPPRSAAKNIQVYIWHLRKLLTRLGAPGRLLREPSGYLIALQGGELDLDRFEEQVRTARSVRACGDTRQAADLFRAALIHWRGPALADLLSMPAIYAESVHLEEIRLAIIQEWLELETAAGNYSTVINACTEAIRNHPFHEYLRVYQIQALHLSGRQGEALAAYDSIRVLLAKEMGLEPSQMLRRLQERILAGELVTVFAGVTGNSRPLWEVPTKRCRPAIRSARP
ncbi:BTAD domain-containing putative transcriptional regulator [Embleya sp. NPDC005971]|uniref:AfsR/SARP family transcriptional regulator n=1 Tax=unclassified Embleya TaxID=2699296 RepID=UPI0033D47E69